MDSLTRVVMAQREVGLSIGEPPATRGYPPSAFALIPRLLERAGVTAEGSVTGIYTTLVEGDDDLGDPVTDAVRGTTDGHILLSRRLSERGQYPPIDVTRSVSRSMNDVVSPEHQRLAQQFRAVLQDLESARELRSVGAYRPGSDPDFDRAMKHADALEGYLRQRRDEVAGFDASLQGLRALMAPMMKEDALLSAERFRFAELALGVIVGTIVGGLVPADAQIIVDPTLPPQLLEGSGVDVVEALRARRASVEERERALAEQERALAIQREELEASLAVFEGEGSGVAAPEVAADGDAGEALVAQAPAPAATTPEPPAGPTPEELEAERAARLDTLARRVQAMNPAAAAAMVTELGRRWRSRCSPPSARATAEKSWTD